MNIISKSYRGYLTIILSCIYAIFILMLGVVVYIADLISRTAILAEVHKCISDYALVNYATFESETLW